MKVIIQPPQNSSSGVLSIYDNAILFAILAFIIFRRLYRGIYGRKYREWRIYFMPMFYIIFTSAIFILDYRIMPFEILGLAAVLAVTGLMIGDRYGERVSFYYNGGELYYKRSPVVLTIWVISYMGRIFLEFYGSNFYFTTSIIDLVLALTTGMLVGETFNILKKKREFAQNNKT